MSATPPDSVAVVIPCFRQARFLAGAIGSVLAQAPRPAEIIVVDDGPDEAVARAAAPFPVTLVRQGNRGLAAARNRGLREALGQRLVFLDADDRLLPGAIAAGLAAHRDNPGSAFVFGGYVEATGRELVDRPAAPVDRLALIRSNRVGMIAAAMFDRAALERVGGFAEDLGMCEDWDLFLRLSRIFPFAAHDARIALYVRHRAAMSRDLDGLRSWIAVVRERERKRGLDGAEEQAWNEGAADWARIYPRHGLAERLRGRLRRLAGRTGPGR